MSPDVPELRRRRPEETPVVAPLATPTTPQEEPETWLQTALKIKYWIAAAFVVGYALGELAGYIYYHQE